MKVPEQDEFGQAFLFPAFGERIQIWTPRWKREWLNSARAQHILKGSAELRIPIMEKEPVYAKKTGSPVGCVAVHLEHPFGGGMPGQAGEAYAARFQMDEE